MKSKIDEIMKNATINDISIGCSGDSVKEIVKNDKTYYLKKAKGNKLDKEYYMFNYLSELHLAPKIVEFKFDGEYSYLFTEKLSGDMICCDEIFDDMNHVIELAAKAINILQSIDVDTCHFYNNLNIKLRTAKYNIEHGLVKTEDMSEESQKRFGSVERAYEYLVNNKIVEEKLVFSHGDLSIPNIFYENEEITGFVDLGDSGIADMWFDIAILVKSLRKNYETDEAEKYLFKLLGIEPKYDIIDYYIILTDVFL